MSEKPNSYPAFPNTGNSTWDLRPAEGMSLRDWFAGKVLEGGLHGVPLATDECENLARRCYMMADAMLAERMKP